MLGCKWQTGKDVKGEGRGMASCVPAFVSRAKENLADFIQKI